MRHEMEAEQKWKESRKRQAEAARIAALIIHT